MTYDYNDTVPKDEVISQDPAANTLVAIGSAVNLVVSSGRPEVPNVVGMSEPNAAAAITAVDNLIVGTVTYDYNDTVPKDEVISQDPAANTLVAIGSAVNLVVSSGLPEVPNVVGMSEPNAAAAITAVDNLIVGTVTYDYNDTVPKDEVISQDPAANTLVLIGSAVNLVVSSGLPEVPNVVGMSEPNAANAITAVDNLVVGTVTYDYNDTIPAGTVITQNPTGGTIVAVGSSVDLVVSWGRAVTVPVVGGMTEADANSRITADGLKVGAVTYKYSDTVAAGIVMSQNPAGGTTVPEGSYVDLVVSLGLSVAVPNVVDQNEAEATSAVAAAGLVSAVSYAYSDTVAKDVVISQDPAGGTVVAVGTTVNILVSQGRPVVPNVVSMAHTAAVAEIESVDNLNVAASYDYHNTVPGGIVVSQDPVGGTQVSVGSTVNIAVSLGRPTVPGVVGSSEAEAIAAIQAVDNLVASVTHEYNNTIPKDKVMSQIPAGGTVVDVGTIVYIVVSSGRPVVPNVLDMTLAEATTTIESIDNLKVSVAYRYDNNEPFGNVLNQYPPGGTIVDMGATVNISVSLGQPVVPGVIGTTLADANSKICSIDNLKVGTVTEDYSDTVEAGRVMSQDPTGGTMVPTGTFVDLVVSLGQPVVPYVVGMSEPNATVAITAVDNLAVGTVTEEYSDTVDEGLVISQEPAGETAVPIGSSVELAISLGKPVVPNVVGMTEPNANTAIAARSLVVGAIVYDHNDVVPLGHVISQDPTAGTTVLVGSAVDLVVSGVAAPNVVGLTEADANSTITGFDLTVGIIVYEYNDTVPAGLVMSQDPNSETMVAAGSAIDLVISGVIVPEVVGETEPNASSAITAGGNLTIGTVNHEYSDTVIAGHVISQTPPGGTVTAPGSPVDLVISIGQPAVPYVGGMTIADANAEIESYRLVLGAVTYIYSDTVAEGLVISQNPAAGTIVPLNTAVDIAVSLGRPEVPNVVGMNESDAIITITSRDSLSIGTVTRQYSDTVEQGIVMSQNPPAGTIVMTGTAVDLLVSLGPPITVPNVVGMPQVTANTTIYAAGLTVGSVTYIYHNTVEFGDVISQDPIAGTVVPGGTPVNLVGSLGQPYVPNVVGMTEAEAISAIISDGNFRVGTVTYKYSDTVLKDHVINQSPRGDTQAPIDSPIDLIVSLGRPEVPYVAGLPEGDANAAISAVDNLTVGMVTYEYSDTVLKDHVINQNPVGGTKVLIGTSVDLLVSLGRPLVPPVVGMSEPNATAAITAVDNLTVGAVTYEHRDTEARDEVVSQNPAGGTSVLIGSSVDLLVSLGKPRVPDVVGMTEGEADTAITAVSLRVGTVTYVRDNNTPPGDVISQDPAAGTEVFVGSAVDLVVSVAVVPNVVDMLKSDANTMLAAAGLAVGTSVYEYWDTIGAGIVIDQDPVAGTELPAGSGVDLVVSLGQPVTVMLAGGNRLVELQNEDGGWDPPPDDGDPATGSDPEKLCAAAMGLAKVYRQSEEPNMLAALEQAKTFLLNKSDSFAVGDGVLAAELDSILGGTECTDYVRANFYDKLAVGSYYDARSDAVHDTNSYIQYLRYRRSVEDTNNMAAWDLGTGLYDAHIVGANTTEWLGSVKTEIEELDSYASSDVLGLAGAVLGLAASGEDFDPQVGEHAEASSVADLAEILAGYQLNSGGFTWNSLFREEGLDETVMETVYAVLALSQVDKPAYLTEVSDAGIYLQNTQLITGGWENYVGSIGEDNAITGAALWGMAVGVGQPLVPDVTGMTEEDANSALVIGGLAVGAVTYEYSDTMPEGLIVNQSPASGTAAPVIGWGVDLAVSLGPARVPYVIDMTEADANSTITAASLVVGTVTYEFSYTVTAGRVIRQSPADATTVPVGSSVDLVVSLGPPVTVPYVIDMNEGEATSAITTAGLAVGTVVYEFNDTVPAGVVISQNPVGGSEAPLGSLIDLVVSSGPPVVVPNVVGRSAVDANSDIAAAGLVTGTLTYEYSDTVDAQSVISQNPVGGTWASVGSSVDLVISRGQPKVPYVLGMTQAAATTAIQAVDNLNVGTVTSQYNDTVPAGLVISQNPAALTIVPTGSVINLIISSGKPEVPNVVGMTQAQAKTTIEAVDSLKVGAVNVQYSDTVAAGRVISQYPGGGAIVPVGSFVDLVVSLGAAATVPEVVGMSQAGASAAIVAANLTVGTITGAHSDTIAAGDVLSQDPVSGTTVPAGSAVNLVVSLGPAATVPDVIDRPQADANSAIGDAGLVVGIVVYQSSDIIPTGTVMNQSPAGGTTVALGSPVDLVVSSGPPLVPNVVGMPEADANSTIAAAGLTVGTVSYEYSDTVGAGDVISQNPVAETPVSTGSPVDLVVSLGQAISVPNVVDMNKTDANSAIAAVGLVVGTVVYEFNDITAAGTVTGQSPAHGTTVPSGTPVDLVVSLGQPVNVLILGGARLMELQNNDGGWDSLPDDGDANSESDPNGFASAAMGLAAVYHQTGDPNILAALEKAKTFLLSKSNNFVVNDAALAVGLDSHFGGTACADYVRVNFYDRLAAGTYYDARTGAIHDTNSYIRALCDQHTGDLSNLGAWEAGLGLYNAHIIGANTTEWIAAVKVEIDELVMQPYDVIGLAGAVLGLAAAGEDYDPQAGAYAVASGLGDLAEALASYQLDTGGFTWWSAVREEGLDETTRETVYALLALNEFERGSYLTEVSDAGIYLQNTQLASGGWEDYFHSVEGELNKTTGEALQGISAATGLPVSVPNVADMNEADAESTLSNFGLTVGAVIYGYSDTVAAGNVLSQNPAGGTRVPAGLSVDLIISLGEAVSVPDVVGMTSADANTTISGRGLAVGTMNYEYSDTITAGVVIGQRPVAYATAPAGSAVDLVISRGRPAVPEVVGLPQAEAAAAIRAVDSLRVGNVTYDFSDTVAADFVISQNPIGLTEVPIGSVVDLVVSMGPAAVVPNVVNMSESGAGSAITAEGLVVGTVVYAYSDTVLQGQVISQNPEGGTQAAVGSGVDLVVSLGEPEVPNVVGLTEDDGISTITIIDNLAIGAVTYAYSDSTELGYIISQNPAGKTKVPTGSTVDLVVSLGQPKVPGVTGMTEANAVDAIRAVDNLAVGTVSYDFNDTVPIGLVISQNPEAETVVPTGSSVDLLVSLGQPIEVPNVAGISQADANSYITAAGLLVGTLTYEYNDTIAFGTVIGQEPAAGTFVPAGFSVNLVVSLGQTISVPNIVELTKAEANTVLAAFGLVVGGSSYEYRDDVAAGIIIGQDPAVGSTVHFGWPVDVVVSLGQPEVVIASGGNRLVGLQNSDGGWDFPLDDGDPNGGSDPNASAGLGLAKAYRRTGDANTLAALQKAKNFLLSKTDDFVVSDGMLAAELDILLDGTACTDHVLTNFFDKLAGGSYYDAVTEGTYDTAGYVQSLRDRRANADAGNLAAWDLGSGLYSAYVVGANTTEWVAGVKAEIDELDGTEGYDVLGLAGAILGLAAAGEDYDPQAGEYAAASSLRDLAETLTGCQLETGGFTWKSSFREPGLDENIRETAYALMALNEFDRAGFLTEISDGGIYLQNVQLTSGGWENYDGSTEGEINEITGEALRGLALITPVLGDFNKDGFVDFGDYAVLASAWLTESGDEKWNPACDISNDKDNAIDALDLAAFGVDWLNGF
ncbi:MAG: PASTA domain-containing protein [Planctomycetota bacterium]